MLCKYMARVFSAVSFLVIIIVLLSSSSEASAFYIVFLACIHTFHTLILYDASGHVLYCMHVYFFKGKSQNPAWPWQL